MVKTKSGRAAPTRRTKRHARKKQGKLLKHNVTLWELSFAIAYASIQTRSQSHKPIMLSIQHHSAPPKKHLHPHRSIADVFRGCSRALAIAPRPESGSSSKKNFYFLSCLMPSPSSRSRAEPAAARNVCLSLWIY
jgi:hypothetical protein